MRRFTFYSYCIWATVVLLLLLHVGYFFHFFYIDLIWNFIHMFGHALGWVGALFMGLSLLYVLRKKKMFIWGKIRFWYYFHITAGLLGILMVFIHSYGKYYGLGGLNLLLVWLILITGVIGQVLYRKLPEEVILRAVEYDKLQARYEDIRKKFLARDAEDENALAQLFKTTPLARIRQTEKKKPSSPTLVRSFAQFPELFREYRNTGRELKSITKRVHALTDAEKKAAILRKQQLLDLVKLERDTRGLLALHELFSLWRKTHVPVSWFMWWVTGIHIFAWWYY